jgi:hypothetical protein
MDIYLDIYMTKDKFLPQPYRSTQTTHPIQSTQYNTLHYTTPHHIQSRYYQSIYKYSVPVRFYEFSIFSGSNLNGIFFDGKCLNSKTSKF